MIPVLCEGQSKMGITDRGRVWERNWMRADIGACTGSYALCIAMVHYVQRSGHLGGAQQVSNEVKEGVISAKVVRKYAYYRVVIYRY